LKEETAFALKAVGPRFCVSFTAMSAAIELSALRELVAYENVKAAAICVPVAEPGVARDAATPSGDNAIDERALLSESENGWAERQRVCGQCCLGLQISWCVKSGSTLTST
jgi:hypothetical protein